MYYFMINGNFKVTLKAKQKAWMKPSKDAGEFIINEKMTKVAMEEVAKANKFKIDSGLSKPDYYGQLENSINNMKGVAIMSEQPITQQVDKIVQDGFNNKKGKWIIIAAMSEVEGINQAKLESMFKETSIRLGLEIDPKAVRASISEYFDAQDIEKLLTDNDSVEALVAGAVKSVKNADDKTSLSVLKKSAKSIFSDIKDWKFPKKAGGKKGGGNSGGLFKSAPEWVAKNKKATGDEVMAYLSEQTKSEQRIKNMYALISGIMMAYNPKFVPVTPVVEEPAVSGQIKEQSAA